jgi:MFS family permease
METTPIQIQRVFLTLMFLYTLAASFIWGINTLFLLDAGLTNAEAFAANAFFTLGEVMFEVPTGILADIWGRRTSYLLGVLTLGLATFLYLLAWRAHAHLIVWAITSILLGLGFTFFSGATDAWLVDALKFTGYKGALETVFAKSQVVAGAAMLIGTVAGGLIAQATNLGVPYILRTLVLGVTFIVAYIYMKDLGFTAKRSAQPVKEIQRTLTTSMRIGFSNPAIRWVMVAAPFTMGVSFYAFYAMQPYLLKLYGNSHAYGIAGIAAAIIALAQIVGGLLAPKLRHLFKRRTTTMIVSVVMGAGILLVIGWTTSFVIALLMLVLWGLIMAATTPIRQAYMNQLIPSTERATVLSFDSLMGSSGGVIVQPILGKAADIWGYPTSFILGAGFQILALPFMMLARRIPTLADTPKE